MKPPFLILYEDEYMLAIAKRPGIACVPAPNTPEYKTVQGIMREWAFAEKGCKPYLLNRLDRETSGVLLMGKFPRHREKLESIFKAPSTGSGQAPSTQKVYLALVKGVPKKPFGRIAFPLEARFKHLKVPAETSYRIAQKFRESSLLEVTILSGRKHQIRKHLAMIHHPLVMDRLYGDFGFNRNYQKEHGMIHMFLHAWKIRFKHPFTQAQIEIKVEPGKF